MDPKMKIEWVKFTELRGFGSLAADFLLLAGNSWLIVVNSNPPHKQDVYQADEGVQVATGHRQLPCIAYAEKCNRPRVVILVYPGFKSVRTLPEMKNGKYLFLEFCDLEILVTMVQEMGSISIQIWNWRTVERLTVLNSEIQNKKPNVRVSLTSPVRLAEWDNCNLNVWQLHPTFRRILPSRNVISFPPTLCTPIDAAWNTDGEFLILDSNNTLYTLNSETGIIQKELNFPDLKLKTNKPIFAFHSQGIFIHAVNQIFFIRQKTPDEWTIGFTIQCQTVSALVNLVNQSGREILIACSENNELFLMKTEKTGPELQSINNYGGGFDKICLVKPECGAFLSHRNGENFIVMWNLNTGRHLMKIAIRHGGLLVMSSSSRRDVVLGFSNGIIDVFSFDTFQRYCLHPTNEPIDDFQFLETNRAFCASSLQNGQFYFYKMDDNYWDVVAFLKIDFKIVGFCLTECPEVALIILIGNSVRVYFLNNRSFVFNKEVFLDEAYMQITRHNDIFCLVPFGSKNFKVFDADLKQKNDVLTGHLISHFRLLIADSVISYGIDGLVVVYDGKEKRTLLSHHRTDGGVAIFDSNSKTNAFIAGAANGCFVSYKNKSFTAPEVKIEEFIIVQELGKISWLRNWEMEKFEKVVEANREIKNNLLERLNAVKLDVKNLLDENEKKPEDEKLPSACFELNITGRENLVELEKLKQCEIHERECAQIRVQDKLSSRIIETTWNLIETPSKELRPILSNATGSVHSYGLFRDSEKENFSWITERRHLIRDFHNVDYLEAWLPRRNTRSSRGLMRKVSLVDDALHEKSHLPFFSTLSHLFLNARELPHSELQVNTQYQANDVFVATEKVIRELMVWFNCEFATVAMDKELELKSLRDRRNRLKQVAAELDELGGSCNLLPEHKIEPTWSETEIPESLLQVSDNELVEPPYLTEEEQNALEAAALEEAIRLEKLRADDFRERALDAMMDGVLDKKWQDEIKKDVARPNFMDEEKHEKWNEEQNRRVKIYQDAVEKLNVERERYKKLLVAEFKQLAASAQETGARFDEKLKQLNGLKLKIESAVCQEQLNVLRMRMEILEKIALARKEEKIKSAITKAEHKLETLADEATKLQDALSEARTFLETLQTRDKNMEKNFKKDFPEYSPIICELLNKLSKKRPKLVGRAGNNAALLNELGRYVVQIEDKTQRLPMPQECLEYLKSLDQLDGPVNTPALVNENSWEILCRLRRAKIDSELKIRAVGLDLNETELTIILWQKMMKGCRESIYRMQTELDCLLNEKRMNELNCWVQIVVPQRIVEVPTTGRMNDFNGALLLSRTLIDDVNEAIRNAGQQKVRAMEKACEFRKGIIYKEWEHQKLRLRVDELQAQLDTLDHVHVTKELQEILNARARGDFVEKGFANLEKEIHAVNVRFERAEIGILQTIDDYERKITGLDQQNNELDARIVALNKTLGKRTLLRDLTAEQTAEKEMKLRMKNIVRRGRLVARTQELSSELAALQAERDLLCLKAYPTLIPN